MRITSRAEASMTLRDACTRQEVNSPIYRILEFIIDRIDDRIFEDTIEDTLVTTAEDGAIAAGIRAMRPGWVYQRRGFNEREVHELFYNRTLILRDTTPLGLFNRFTSIASMEGGIDVLERKEFID